MITKNYVHIYTANCRDGVNFTDRELQSYPASRAMRVVDDPTRFLLVRVSMNANEQTLRKNIPLWFHEGVRMNNIPYRFLGFTDSQVKTGKLMFFREGDDWTVKRLLTSFGDLDSVYLKSGYGKYAARLQLSFSSTVQSLDVPNELAVQIPDLKAPDGSLHSDGCGMIRNSLAVQICAYHALPPDTSVFQIRRGGIKGLLVRYPDTQFDNLTQAHCRSDLAPLIAYRPSMYKYDGGPTVLELHDHNLSPGSARLNFQIMVLLLTLDIHLEVFERLVQDQLDLIGCILTDREKALTYIKGELDAAAEDDFVQGLFAMLLAQQDLSEPYVKQRLQQFQNKQYESLRKKMCLRITDSCSLFGVVDEDGVLGPDEVYINLPSRNGVLVRDVFVVRNPCYHPGDIRKLRAVDHPTLRHHHDCLVFSRTAPHSIPDTIASGDLDGDKYFVTWDPSLLPQTEAAPFNRAPSSAAAAQTGAQPPPPPRQLSDMPKAALETFMQLKYSMLLGMISNEWSRQVEKTPDLATAEYPQALVPLIESSLDIMKSGEDVANLQSQFTRLRNLHSNRSFNSYKGPIQSLREMIPQTEKESTRLDATRCDKALVLQNEDPQLWDDYVIEARRVMPRYNGDLRLAINLDEHSTAELGPNLSRHERDDSPRAADGVKHDYKKRYFGGGSKTEQNEQRMRASAWYHYGYTQNKPSFAWLGERYLNEIKAWCSNGNRPPLFVGATVHRLPAASSWTPLARMDSEATLVDESTTSSQPRAKGSRQDYEPTEIDTYTESDAGTKAARKLRSSSSVECPARRFINNIVASPQNHPSRSPCSITAHPVRVSVASNPSPRVPVAFQYNLPNEYCPLEHRWVVSSANGYSRQYICRECGIRIHEKKDGYWICYELITDVRRRGLDESPRSCGRHKTPSTITGSSRASLERDGVGEIDDAATDDAMSIYESARDDERPLPVLSASTRSVDHRGSAGPRCSSTGTTSSDAPSSLCELSGVRRLLRVGAGVDVSSPIGRRRQVSSRRISSLSTIADADSEAPASQSPAPELPSPNSDECSPAIDAQLVSSNPKPRAPVAVRVLKRCQGSAVHMWKIWGGATHRKYTCLVCRLIVKERKAHQPQVWVSAD